MHNKRIGFFGWESLMLALGYLLKSPPDWVKYSLLIGGIVGVIYWLIFEIKESKKNKIDKYTQGSSNITSFQRMPLIEFFKLAKSKGWILLDQYNYDSIDLEHGLNQAILDGDIEIWGKEHQHSLLRKITREEWKGLQISHQCYLDIDKNTDKYIGITEDNSSTEAHSNEADGSMPKIKYIDIHLHEDQATNWLETSAQSYSGQTQKRVDGYQA